MIDFLIDAIMRLVAIVILSGTASLILWMGLRVYVGYRAERRIDARKDQLTGPPPDDPFHESYIIGVEHETQVCRLGNDPRHCASCAAEHAVAVNRVIAKIDAAYENHQRELFRERIRTGIREQQRRCPHGSYRRINFLAVRPFWICSECDLRMPDDFDPRMEHR